MKRYVVKLMALLSTADVVVVLSEGIAARSRGNIPAPLLSEIGLLADELDIDHGCLFESKQDGHKRLTFFGIPAKHQQRFRNVWHANRS